MNDRPNLSAIKIVLVEPSGPLNVGASARIMKNMGLSQLVLVNPQCDLQSPEAKQMAVHAQEILSSAQVVDSLPEALQNCQKVAATMGRTISLPTALETPNTLVPWLLSGESALIFGREDRGLTNEELNLAQRFVQIPSHPVYPSLNLAQSVAICCYELYRCTLETQTEEVNSSASDLASRQVLEAYYDHLESLLLEIGYLYPHTANRRMEKLKRFYNRAYPTEADVAMLRGILSQVQWAISNTSPSKGSS
ncbi:MULTISPECIES: RNA methyltransferase [unclassified Roseofilum]|uniref:RNA methyltransferase n=1 Tax=unclassified Roseofilum TaxID=2620099 RepID=UPI001B0B2800|nr:MULTISPECIES: RNA methyltransferase [unclassified Roseofilum]MBP0009715.1 RNA methyltransferase [Roseofilum sp. Belize Diploria]MBP0035091.1 RNA methyltransferase [Roseofilum sp. Belize BBD 4]